MDIFGNLLLGLSVAVSPVNLAYLLLGATIGMMETRSRVPAGPVIVDPRALEDRDVYRGMPILTRRTVGSGSHERWHDGTMRRLRDARSLAIVSMVTTVVSVIARVLGG